MEGLDDEPGDLDAMELYKQMQVISDVELEVEADMEQGGGMVGSLAGRECADRR